MVPLLEVRFREQLTKHALGADKITPVEVAVEHAFQDIVRRFAECTKQHIHLAALKFGRGAPGNFRHKLKLDFLLLAGIRESSYRFGGPLHKSQPSIFDRGSAQECLLGVYLS